MEERVGNEQRGEWYRMLELGVQRRVIHFRRKWWGREEGDFVVVEWTVENVALIVQDKYKKSIYANSFLQRSLHLLLASESLSLRYRTYRDLPSLLRELCRKIMLPPDKYERTGCAVYMDQ